MDLLTTKPNGEKREKGQIIVILALAMVGLLAVVGLATDVGILFMERAHLERATDAAALAGVVRLAETNDLAQANVRGMQLLAANTIVLDSPVDCDSVNWDVHDYCGHSSPGTIPSSIAYHVETRWDVETYFMKVLSIQFVTIGARATAEYMPLVDIFASDSSESGLVRSANQAVFGPKICTGFGDPVSPLNSAWYSDREGRYTYRIRVPYDYRQSFDQVRVELFDPDTSNKNNTATSEYRIFDLYGNSYFGNNSPTSEPDTRCTTNQKNPCLLRISTSMQEIYQSSNTLSTAEEAERLALQDELNPFWLVRIDENRGAGSGDGNGTCSEPSSYTSSYNTRTVYRLYYLQQQADGRLVEIDLAYYVGKNDSSTQPVYSSSPYTAAQAAAEALATDMHWVSPGSPSSERLWATRDEDDIYDYDITWPSELGALNEPLTRVEDCDAFRTTNPAFSDASMCSGNGDFIVNIRGGSTEVPGIYVDPESGVVDIFMDVRTVSGASENGFEIWAGPPLSANPDLYDTPSEINARQNYIVHQRGNGTNVHSSEGISIFAVGYLPMNSTATATAQLPLAFFTASYANQDMTVSLFDSDSGAGPPVSFYFDSIPNIDWTACYAASSNQCSAAGGQSSHYLGDDQIPNDNRWANYAFQIPGELDTGVNIPFYGGRMSVHYNAGANDTFVWRIVIDSRPYLTE